MLKLIELWEGGTGELSMKLGLGLETGGNGSQGLLHMLDGQTEYKQILRESEAGHSKA